MWYKKLSMQISAAITEKCICSYSLVNITENGTIRVFTSMFIYRVIEDNKLIFRVI